MSHIFNIHLTFFNCYLIEKFYSIFLGQIKSAAHSPIEQSSASITSEPAGGNAVLKQFSPQLPGNLRVQNNFETGSKVLELSSKFSSVEKSKSVASVTSSTKASDVLWGSMSVDPLTTEDVVQVPRKEFADLKSKVSTSEIIVPSNNLIKYFILTGVFSIGFFIFYNFLKIFSNSFVEKFRVAFH